MATRLRAAGCLKVCWKCGGQEFFRGPWRLSRWTHGLWAKRQYDCGGPDCLHHPNKTIGLSLGRAA